jgi:CelD/BcsL family acetyltransferase involved in cellulose biosynthesis
MTQPIFEQTINQILEPTKFLASSAVYELDPLEDERWPRFLERRDDATVFHSPQWLKALSCTYGYRASVVTTAGPGAELKDGLVFCHVRSWLTGRRIIALPFSDHCGPLVDSATQLECLLHRLKQDMKQTRGRHIEIRPAGRLTAVSSDLGEFAAFCWHRLDLRPSLEEIFRSSHRNSVQRRISRACRAGLFYEEGRSEELLEKFFRLMVLTRRRHLVPPQPLTWFRNLIACLGDTLKIRMVSSDGKPAAAILTIRYKRSLCYKYGCSDKKLQNLGGMQLLFWTAIQEAKNDGLMEFDLGRTDWDNAGLLTFKDRWGARRSPLTYLRYPAPKFQSSPGAQLGIVKRIFDWAPDSVLTAIGQLLYRHIA